MALYTVSTGQTVQAADVNQLVNILQRTAGQTETGKYKITGNGNASGCNISCYIPSLSRGTTPVSVTIDTADQAPTALNTPATFNLTASGFAIIASTTGATLNAFCAGNYTIQY